MAHEADLLPETLYFFEIFLFFWKYFFLNIEEKRLVLELYFTTLSPYGLAVLLKRKLT